MVDLELVGGRLAAFLQEQTGEPVVVDDLRLLTGGYSLVTVAFTATTDAGSASYVLRTNPPGDAALTQSDRAKEAEILGALTDAGTVPMPELRWADPTGEALGSPSLVLDFIDGPPLLARLREVEPDEFAALALQLAETIGTVHVAGNAAAPASLERPATWDEYVDGFIDGWRAVERAYPERDPFIRWVADWLDGHRPPPAPLTLVHGEFQTGNVMLDSSGAMQVIDWEYAHIGDPRVDLGWIQNVAAFAPPDPIAVDPVGFCRRYCEVTGLDEEVVNPSTVAWFTVAAGYKSMGALLQGIAAVATGDNHLITSAYLVSAMPFIHRLWRETVRRARGGRRGRPVDGGGRIMMTQPSTARIIHVIRQELAENVLPVTTDVQAQASLQMIDHILATVAVRVQREIAWMVEEADAIGALGEQIAGAEPAATGVAAALAALRAAPLSSLEYDDVAARYSLAGEVLSCAFEEVPTDSPLRPSVEAQLDTRLRHEVEIMGEFELVART